MALGSRKRKGGLSALSEVLTKAYPNASELGAARVMAAWPDVVPERVLEAARPVRFRRGELLVHTKSSAWANELSLMMPQFLVGLRKRLPGVSIVQIRFKVGPLPERPLDRHRPKRRPAPRAPLSELPEQVGQALAGIADDEVRAQVEEAARVGLARPTRKGR